MSEKRIAVLDVDGTLVDSNYQHAMAWYRALRSLDETFPIWRIHRLIGMGGDKLVTSLGGEELEARIGEEARERQGKEVDALLDEIAPLPGARDLADAWTSSADADETKPAPDLLQVALKKLGAAQGAPSVMVGDTPFDVEAAKKAGMPAIVVRSGGFGDDELREAGAVAIFDTPADLAADLDNTDLA